MEIPSKCRNRLKSNNRGYGIKLENCVGWTGEKFFKKINNWGGERLFDIRKYKMIKKYAKNM